MSCTARSSSTIDEYFYFAVTLVRKAGEILADGMKLKHQFTKKSSRVDLVTQYDTKIENLLITELKKVFPDHKFIAEESSKEGECELTDSPTWIIDPIDGTMNFVHGFPYCCISVGLLVERKIEAGIVFNPSLDQIFTAKRGQGAFCNGKKLLSSSVENLGEALLISEMGSFRDSIAAEVFHKNMDAFFHNAHSVRFMGSAALNLCTVAAGQADVYIEAGIHCWDMAAGVLIAKEAGAVVTNVDGSPFDFMSRKIICASCRQIADELAQAYTVYSSLIPDSKVPALNVL